MEGERLEEKRTVWKVFARVFMRADSSLGRTKRNSTGRLG